MRYKKLLVSILVILVLLGYIVCSAFLFYNAFEILDENGNPPIDPEDLLGPGLIYTINVLNGLVGGIVAKGFGVKFPESSSNDLNFQAARLQNLGSFISSISKENKKKLYGLLYALGYILVGTTSVVIWLILADSTIHFVTNMATTFLGLLLLIVPSFINPN